MIFYFEKIIFGLKFLILLLILQKKKNKNLKINICTMKKKVSKQINYLEKKHIKNKEWKNNNRFQEVKKNTHKINSLANLSKL